MRNPYVKIGDIVRIKTLEEMMKTTERIEQNILNCKKWYKEYHLNDSGKFWKVTKVTSGRWDKFYHVVLEHQNVIRTHGIADDLIKVVIPS